MGWVGYWGDTLERYEKLTHMDSLTFISELVDALAWPATVLVIVWLLRGPLTQLIPEVRKLKYRDFEAEFGREVEDLRERMVNAIPPSKTAPEKTESFERLEELARIAPNAAVLEAWKEVEAAARRLLAAHGLEVDSTGATPYLRIEQMLQRGEYVEESRVKIFKDLRRLRNKVAHATGYEISHVQAQEYIELALALKESLDEEG